MADDTTPSQTHRKHLIAPILARFRLPDTAVTAFAAAIYHTQIAAAQAAYQAAAVDLGLGAIAVAPPDSVLHTLATQSKASGTSIVETYQSDLQAEAERFVQAYADQQGTLDGAASALHSDLMHWTDARQAWKAEQIARYETNRGYATGMQWLVSDIQADAVDLPDGTTKADLVVTVIPGESSGDSACASYAGQSYPIDQAAEIADKFPAHPNCIHSIVIEFAS